MGYQLSSFINVKGGASYLIRNLIVHIKPDYDYLSTCCHLVNHNLKLETGQRVNLTHCWWAGAPLGPPFRSFVSMRRDSFHWPLNQDKNTNMPEPAFYLSLYHIHVHHATLAKGK